MSSRHLRTRPHWHLLVLFFGFTLLAASCSSDDTADPTTMTAAAQDLADEPAYRGPGPYEVGLTGLSLPDRDVAVF